MTIKYEDYFEINDYIKAIYRYNVITAETHSVLKSKVSQQIIRGFE